MPRRALVAGWFSFEEFVATVGDTLGAEVTVEWLTEAGWSCDVAMAPYMREGVDWRTADPAGYDLLIFTTGPLHPNPRLLDLLARFDGPRWAINVSVVDEGMRSWFDLVWERDADGVARPDLGFAAAVEPRPLLAVAWAPPQAEYGEARHDHVHKTVDAWLYARQHAVVELDMDMYAHHRWPRVASQVTSVIARADAVVSMRLHAAVLALAADDITDDRLDRALQWCLGPDAPPAITASRAGARRGIDDLRRSVGAALGAP